MKLTRRQFGQGILATGALVALPIPVLAAKYHEVEKSFFATQSWPLGYNKRYRDTLAPCRNMQVHVLRVRNHNHRLMYRGMNIGIYIEVVGPDNSPHFEVESLGHAEYKFLHTKHASRDSYDFSYKYENARNFECKIIRMTNIIARKTRRGPGNIVIYHPDNSELMNIAHRRTGRVFKLWETKNCPRDKIVCIYKGQGEVDSGYIYADTGERKYLWEMQDNTKYIGNAHDFVQEISLRNI